MSTDKYPILDDVSTNEDYFHFRTQHLRHTWHSNHMCATAWEIMPNQDDNGGWLVHVYEIATDTDGNYVERGEMDSRHDFPSLAAAIRYMFNNMPDLVRLTSTDQQ